MPLFQFPGAKRFVIIGREGGFNPGMLSPFAWYDPSDLGSLAQASNGSGAVAADGNPVGYMADKSGNGRHLVQASATLRPAYKASGGLSWLQFDGVDDYLEASFTSPGQPVDRISAIYIIAAGADDNLMKGSGASGFEGGIYATANTDVHIYDGITTVAFAVNPTAGTNFVITERHSGAASRIVIDNGTYATGNPGTTFSDGLRVGGNSPNFRFGGMAMFNRALADSEITALRTYFAAKQGRSL